MLIQHDEVPLTHGPRALVKSNDLLGRTHLALWPSHGINTFESTLEATEMLMENRSFRKDCFNQNSEKPKQTPNSSQFSGMRCEIQMNWILRVKNRFDKFQYQKYMAYEWLDMV